MERAFLAAVSVRETPAKASKSLDIAFPDSERFSTGSRERVLVCLGLHVMLAFLPELGLKAICMG